MLFILFLSPLPRGVPREGPDSFRHLSFGPDLGGGKIDFQFDLKCCWVSLDLAKNVRDLAKLLLGLASWPLATTKDLDLA